MASETCTAVRETQEDVTGFACLRGQDRTDLDTEKKRNLVRGCLVLVRTQNKNPQVVSTLSAQGKGKLVWALTCGRCFGWCDTGGRSSHATHQQCDRGVARFV